LAAEVLAGQPLAPGERVDPNTASLEELRRLPGIGPSRATAIVAERASGGPFTDLDDLTRVPGIGPTGLTKLAPHMALGRRRNASVAALSAEDAAPVDVNRAQIKELEQITGIGPVLASRILETRRRVGRFQGPEDLLLVPGIGPAILARIRGQVRF
jgi:competence protein ComEA